MMMTIYSLYVLLQIELHTALFLPWQGCLTEILPLRTGRAGTVTPAGWPVTCVSHPSAAPTPEAVLASWLHRRNPCKQRKKLGHIQ